MPSPSEVDAPEFPPELARGVNALARALVAATQSWALYPPHHPAVQASHDRLALAIQDATAGAVFAVGVTPETLIIDGRLAPASEPVADAARLLHECDLLQIAFAGAVPAGALRTLLGILTLDGATRRQRGGPAAIWAREGHPSIALQQVDYGRVLEDRGEQAPPERRDDLWQSIVQSIVSGRKTTDEREQLRLLAIAGDPDQIRELAAAVMAPMCAGDGSPMVTTQAATILAAFRQMASIVSVKAPEQVDGLMRNLAEVTSDLDPHVAMQLLQSEDDPAEGVKVVHGMTAAFDDEKVAELLATALSAEGQATSRLAEAFDTIAPDAERKRRVLTMARTRLTQTEFGQMKQFKAIWASMEQLLLSYNEAPYVSEGYRTALAGAGGRAAAVAARDLPEELPEWMASLDQDHMRRLSVTLIVDLLHIERDRARAAEIAADMALLAEDLLMSGEYGGARDVAAALADAAGRTDAIAPAACQEALDALAASSAMQETVALLGEFGETELDLFAAMCRAIGPAMVEPLGEALRIEAETPGGRRAADLVVAFGPPAVARLQTLVEDDRWFVRCRGADLLGRIAAPESVPLLQPLLRGDDQRVTRHAVAALAGIDDPAAARAIHTRPADGHRRASPGRRRGAGGRAGRPRGPDARPHRRREPAVRPGPRGRRRRRSGP